MIIGNCKTATLSIFLYKEFELSFLLIEIFSREITNPSSDFDYLLQKNLKRFFKPSTSDHIIGCLPLFIGRAVG